MGQATLSGTSSTTAIDWAYHEEEALDVHPDFYSPPIDVPVGVEAKTPEACSGDDSEPVVKTEETFPNKSNCKDSEEGQGCSSDSSDLPIPQAFEEPKEESVVSQQVNSVDVVCNSLSGAREPELKNEEHVPSHLNQIETLKPSSNFPPLHLTLFGPDDVSAYAGRRYGKRGKRDRNGRTFEEGDNESCVPQRTDFVVDCCERPRPFVDLKQEQEPELLSPLGPLGGSREVASANEYESVGNIGTHDVIEPLQIVYSVLVPSASPFEDTVLDATDFNHDGTLHGMMRARQTDMSSLGSDLVRDIAEHVDMDFDEDISERDLSAIFRHFSGLKSRQILANKNEPDKNNAAAGRQFTTEIAFVGELEASKCPLQDYRRHIQGQGQNIRDSPNGSAVSRPIRDTLMSCQRSGGLKRKLADVVERSGGVRGVMLDAPLSPPKGKSNKV